EGMHAGQHVELAQEPSRTVTSDEPLVAVGSNQDVHRSRHDDIEVVSGVPLRIQVVAHGRRPTGPESIEYGNACSIERREQLGIVRHGHVSSSRTRGMTWVPYSSM